MLLVSKHIKVLKSKNKTFQKEHFFQAKRNIYPTMNSGSNSLRTIQKLTTEKKCSRFSHHFGHLYMYMCSY